MSGPNPVVSLQTPRHRDQEDARMQVKTMYALLHNIM